MSNKVPKINLEKLDDLLAFVPKEKPMTGGIEELDIKILKPFANHKFKQYEGQQLEDMVESVKTMEILLPVIVWHTEDGSYTILSDYNRVTQRKLPELQKFPLLSRAPYPSKRLL